MKMKKKYLMILAVVSLFLSGCGTTLYELTAEEEELIIQSAAYFVAKHNIQQKDGISNIILEETESESKVEQETQQPTEETTTTESENSGNNTSSDNPTVIEAEVSLAEAIGHAADLQITYEGASLANDYMDGGYISSPEGYTYFIMKFKITNISAVDVNLNNMALHPAFRITSQGITAAFEQTVLLSDFSTFIGTVPAGQSVDTVLFFPVEASKAQSISAPTLYVTLNKESKKVKL